MKNVKLKDWLFIIFGISFMAAAIQMFYSPNNMVVGGFSGLGIVIMRYTGIPVSVSNIALNIPLFLIAIKLLGKRYTVKSIVGSVLFSVILEAISFLPEFKGDILVVALYGGILDGIGVGLVIRAMASTGGVDLFATIIHRIKGYIPVSVIMFAFNAGVIALGLFVFGAEKGMYAVISAFVSERVSNMLISGFNFSKAALIISDKSKEIQESIMENTERGVTVFNAKGGYTNKEKEVILCVFSYKEIISVKSIVRNIDKNAFIIFSDIKEVLGEGFDDIEKLD